jgi:hypothetical protein
MARTKSVFETYDYKKTDEYKLHLKVLDRVSRMTPEEKVQSLIDAGIITKDRKLSARYGGPGEPTED